VRRVIALGWVLGLAACGGGSDEASEGDAVATDAAPADATRDAMPADATRDAMPADASPADAAPPDAAPPDAAVPAVTWTPCPLITGLDGHDAECATVQVPVRRDHPEGRRIPIAVKRLRTGNDRGQVWLLQGGPGGTVKAFEPIARDFAARSGGLDVYMPEHRGVGDSARLGCPAQEADDSDQGLGITPEEIPACFAAVQAEWGDDLQGFSTTEAARDLGELIAATRTPGKPVYVLGISYGTYWAHRYLQLFPAQPTGVILDSICAPGECRFPLRFAQGADANGRALLGVCAADADCAAELGGDPVAFATDLMTRIDGGHCPGLVGGDGPSPDDLRMFLGSLEMDVDLRRLVPAVLHRLDRCDDDDVAAVHALADALAPPADPSPLDRAGSPLAYFAVARQELWEDPAPTLEAYTAAFRALVFALGTEPQMLDAAQSFPAAPRDAYWGQYAETDVPLLMMNGTLDPQTPLAVAQPLGEHLHGPNQHFVVVERSPHGVLTSARYADDPRQTCGWDLFEQFVRDPTGPLDTSCSTRTAAVDFSDDPTLAATFFGTDSLYGDGLKSGRRGVADPALKARVLQRMRLR
jgi:pimeloyl-ACP methyl ester carboxylesterase